MPKIFGVAALRHFYKWSIFDVWQTKRQTIGNNRACDSYLLKSAEYLNFRHFRHFEILGISSYYKNTFKKYILSQYNLLPAIAKSRF